MAIEADLAQRARDLGDAEAEADAIARAGIMLSRAQAAAAAGRPMETAYAATAVAHHLRATGDDPGEAWSAAADAWTARGRPLLVAAAQRHAAEACLARGRRDGATEAAGIALAGARRIGAVWLVDELEGLIARARLTLEPDGDGGATADADGTATDAEDDLDPFGLTPRERQVLTLVARGCTNREIGAELYMAEKTASVHVSRILAKLDVRSRTEAAAVAHRLGLAAG